MMKPIKNNLDYFLNNQHQSCQFDFEIKLFTSKTSCLYTSYILYMSLYYNKRVLHENESHLPRQREVTPLIWKRVNLKKKKVV